MKALLLLWVIGTAAPCRLSAADPPRGGFEPPGPSARAVRLRLAFFHGARTKVLMRMEATNKFKRLRENGVDVVLLAKSLRGGWSSYVGAKDIAYDEDDEFGKSTGEECIRGLEKGRWQLATAGEGSFLAAAARGAPIVAVARLGHNTKGRSGQVFALREGLTISRPSDYLGTLLVTRRAGPGDLAFLLEYLSQAGVDVRRDTLFLERLPASPAEKAQLPKDKVLLVQGVFEDDLDRAVRDGVVDGGYFHIPRRRWLERLRGLRPVKRMHEWVDPEFSNALLVCRRDFLDDAGNRQRLRALLYSLMLQIREDGPGPQKAEGAAADPWKGTDPGALSPAFKDVPVVNTAPLAGMLELLRRHTPGDWPAVDLSKHVDNSLVLDAARQLPPPAPERRALREPDAEL